MPSSDRTLRRRRVARRARGSPNPQRAGADRHSAGQVLLAGKRPGIARLGGGTMYRNPSGSCRDVRDGRHAGRIHSPPWRKRRQVEFGADTAILDNRLVTRGLHGHRPCPCSIPCAILLGIRRDYLGRPRSGMDPGSTWTIASKASTAYGNRVGSPVTRSLRIGRDRAMRSASRADAALAAGPPDIGPWTSHRPNSRRPSHRTGSPSSARAAVQARWQSVARRPGSGSRLP